MAIAKLDDTGERMIPEFHRGHLMYAEHFVRYEAALELVRDKVVLDIASGSGYGTRLLAGSAKHVHGVDISEEAVQYARENFRADNADYAVGAATAIPLDDASVDVVVTFETIEHIGDYRAFIDEIDRVLRPDGIAIISTPNDLEFAEGNHFHLHEFEREELLALIAPRFDFIDEYYQATWKYVSIGTLDDLGVERVQRDTLNFAPLEMNQLLYFYFVCSRSEITHKVSPISAIGEHFSDRSVSELHQHIGNLELGIRMHEANAIAVTAELAQIKGSRSFRLAQRLSRLRSLTRR